MATLKNWLDLILTALLIKEEDTQPNTPATLHPPHQPPVTLPPATAVRSGDITDGLAYALNGAEKEPDAEQEPAMAEKEPSNYRIKAVASTFLKDFPHASYKDCESWKQIPKGTVLGVDECLNVDDVGHNFFLLTTAVNGVQQWWGYSPDWEVSGTKKDNDPTEAVPNAVEVAEPKIIKQPKRFKVPGITAPVAVTDPIYYKGSEPSNFLWGEFTKDGSRVPENETVTRRIIETARYMDDVRAYLGDRPIKITSGYRDPVSNRYVGGARDSRHMYGDAIDFFVYGLGVVDVFYKLKAWDRCPTGLAVGNGFVHIDRRRGAKARWLYRGGPRVALW